MLTNILLALIVAAFMLYGYKVCGHIDNWVEDEVKEQQKEEPAEEEKTCGVIFGREDQERIGQWMEGNGIEPVYMEDIYFRKEWPHVKYVVAVSDSDTDNIIVCNLAQKMYHAEYVFGICNEKRNYSMFQKFHIHTLNRNNIQTQLDSVQLGNGVA